MVERSNTHLTDAQLAELKGLLLARRAELLERLRRAVADDEQLRAQLGVADAEDLADEGALLEVSQALEEGERRELEEIAAALERIERGTYGVCEVSGEPIPYERLRRIPWARYTVEVEERIEAGASLDELLERAADQSHIAEEAAPVLDAEANLLDEERYLEEQPPAPEEELHEFTPEEGSSGREG